MNPFPIFCLLASIGGCLAATNALCDKSVLVHSNPQPAVLFLANNSGNVVTDLGTPAVSYCLYVNLDDVSGKERHHILNYFSKEQNEAGEISLMVLPGDKVTRVYFHRKTHNFPVIPPIGNWSHICMTWSPETAVFQLYFDGVEVAKVENAEKGGKIGGDGALSLGQEQDTYVGGFDLEDGVHGQLTQFNAWTKDLTADEVKQAMDGELFGDLVDWRNSYWVMNGYTVGIDSTTPNADAMSKACGSGSASSECKTTSADGEATSTDLSICLRFDCNSCEKEMFQLFSYENSCGSKELAFVVNQNRSTTLVIGSEERQLSHLQVHPGSQHWCFVWSTGSMSVYIDGQMYDVLTDFTDGTSMSMNGDLYTYEANSRKRVTPEARDYAVWERALSTSEVEKEYNSVMGKQNQVFISVSGVSANQPYAATQQRIWRPVYYFQ